MYFPEVVSVSLYVSSFHSYLAVLLAQNVYGRKRCVSAKKNYSRVSFTVAPCVTVSPSASE